MMFGYHYLTSIMYILGTESFISSLGDSNECPFWGTTDIGREIGVKDEFMIATQKDDGSCESVGNSLAGIIRK